MAYILPLLHINYYLLAKYKLRREIYIVDQNPILYYPFLHARDYFYDRILIPKKYLAKINRKSSIIYFCLSFTFNFIIIHFGSLMIWHAIPKGVSAGQIIHVQRLENKGEVIHREELKPLVTAWSHLGPFLDLGPPALGLAVDRVLANHSLSSTASQGRSNIPLSFFPALGIRRGLSLR